MSNKVTHIAYTATEFVYITEDGACYGFTTRDRVIDGNLNVPRILRTLDKNLCIHDAGFIPMIAEWVTGFFLQYPTIEKLEGLLHNE